MVAQQAPLELGGGVAPVVQVRQRLVHGGGRAHPVPARAPEGVGGPREQQQEDARHHTRAEDVRHLAAALPLVAVRRSLRAIAIPCCLYPCVEPRLEGLEHEADGKHCQYQRHTDVPEPLRVEVGVDAGLGHAYGCCGGSGHVVGASVCVLWLKSAE